VRCRLGWGGTDCARPLGAGPNVHGECDGDGVRCSGDAGGEGDTEGEGEHPAEGKGGVDIDGNARAKTRARAKVRAMVMVGGGWW
jgi:hypothetical protein